MPHTNGKQDEETVEQIAEDVKARVGKAAEQARDELADVQSQLRELRRDLVNRALTAKDRVVEELLSAAQRIRSEGQESEDEETIEQAAEIAEGLERTARYLDTRNLEKVGGEINEAVQSNVWPVVLGAFVVGLVIGLLFGLGRRR
jgi:histidinol dehydrogenase